MIQDNMNKCKHSFSIILEYFNSRLEWIYSKDTCQVDASLSYPIPWLLMFVKVYYGEHCKKKKLLDRGKSEVMDALPDM